jgi:hypothetical protein
MLGCGGTGTRLASRPAAVVIIWGVSMTLLIRRG